MRRIIAGAIFLVASITIAVAQHAAAAAGSAAAFNCQAGHASPNRRDSAVATSTPSKPIVPGRCQHAARQCRSVRR